MRNLEKKLIALSAAFLAASCLTSCGEKTESDPYADPGEPAQSQSLVIPVDGPNLSDAGSSLEAQDLDAGRAFDLIDIRGVGDSGWSRTHQPRPLAPEFARALDQFDPTGRSYRGDLSFINWESVVGESCQRFANQFSPGLSYAFVSDPANIAQAFDKGFQIFGLSNNHSRDCTSAFDGRGTAISGTEMSIRSMESMEERYSALMWHGLARRPADKTRLAVKTHRIKNRALKIAFASLYTGRQSCPDAVCLDDAGRLLEAFRVSDADLKILSIHSGFTGERELVEIGKRFIGESGGDIVFGHGPHVWKAVRVIPKTAGRGKGVLFESLGNFIHPNIAAKAQNYIGRALFDTETLTLRQVQIIPVHNSGMSAQFSSASGLNVPSNLSWRPAEWLLGNRLVRGAYSNIR